MSHEELYYRVKVSSCQGHDSESRKAERVFGIMSDRGVTVQVRPHKYIYC